MVILFNDNTWKFCEDREHAILLYRTHHWGVCENHDAIILDDYEIVEVLDEKRMSLS